MRQFIVDGYNGVMNAKYNPLKYIPNDNTRHILMLALMWMWATVFAVWTGTMFYMGASIFFHFLLFLGLLITLDTFKMANAYESSAQRTAAPKV